MEGFKPVRLAYSTHEPATGADETLAPIIYLHGVTAFRETWSDIPQKVADATKRKSYSVDARNHGDSEWSDHFNFDVNAEDLLHFLDTMDIPKAVLVGHSMGGSTAMRVALKKPDRVESIVVEDMIVSKFPKSAVDSSAMHFGLLMQAVEKSPADLNDEETGKFILQYLMNNYPRELMELLKKSGKQSWETSAFRRDSEGRLTWKCNMEAIYKTLSAEHDGAACGVEGMFDGPAVFIYGTLSHIKVTDDEKRIKQFFPNAVLEGIAADHNVHASKPVEFTDAVLRFFSIPRS